MGFKTSQITPEIIELKRLKIKLYRELKKAKEEIHGSF